MGSAAVVTMEQGGLLQQQLPIHNDYSLPADPDCIDHFNGHANHQSYTTGGALDPLRRDTPLTHQPLSSYGFAPPSNHAHPARFVSDRGAVQDSSSYPGAANLTDSSNGSISTSPSSASSFQQYATYAANHYTSLPSFSGPVSLPQAFVQSSYAGPRAQPILELPGQGMLPPPRRSPITHSSNGVDRDMCSNGTPFVGRNQLSPHSQVGYASYPDTPRTSFSSTLALSPGSVGYSNSMASSSAQAYGTQASECADFPWVELQVLADMTCEGHPVTPEVHARVEKGFFRSPDSKWTCYRRNYFSVACSFELHQSLSNGHLYVKHRESMEKVQAMGMRLSAVVDGQQGKSIELVQHTPKRDQGPKTKVEITKVSPMPTGRADPTVSPNGIYQVPMPTFHATGATAGPLLPLQHDSKSSGASLQTPQMSSQFAYSASVPHLQVPGQNTNHTFERVQFKQATANNGKRRASQQYFHLLVELYADARKDGAKDAVWVKVAHRMSEKIVVRGRSPSHYQNEGQHGSAGRSGSAGGSGAGYSTAGAGYGTMNPGGFRGSSNLYESNMGGGGGGYRTHHSSSTFQASPEHRSSRSSSSTIDGAPVDAEQPLDNVMSDAERAGVQEYDGYQYYPSTIYEGMAQQLPPIGHIEAATRYSTEPRQYSVKTEYPDAVAGAQWHAGSCSRFHGTESSRGYFPDLQSNYTS